MNTPYQSQQQFHQMQSAYPPGVYNPSGVPNPNQNFSPLSQTQFRNSNKFGNFNSAYVPNTPIINQMSFESDHKFLHDNVNDITKEDNLFETSINIYSLDRDLSSYPSAFKFKTMFGQAQGKTERKSDGSSIRSQSAPAPTIDRVFKQIKYVVIESIILPRSISIDTSSGDPSLYVMNINTTYNLENKGFLVLNIQELEQVDTFAGTGNIVKNTSFLLIPDQELGKDRYLWKPVKKSVVYKRQYMKEITSLTTTIVDDQGNDITIVDENGNNFYPQFNELVSTSPTSSYPNIIYLNNVMQSMFNIIFGILCIDVNTNTTYNGSSV